MRSPALLALAKDAHPYTRAFAAKGLGALKDRTAVPTLLPLSRRRDRRCPIEAIRALGKIGDAAAAQPLVRLVQTRDIPPPIRLEAVTALGSLQAPGVANVVIDLLGDTGSADSRRGAQSGVDGGLRRIRPVLSGLDPDPDWHVRAALASLLGTLPRQSALPRLHVDARPTAISA